MTAASSRRAPAIRYRIAPVDPGAHLFEVELAVDDPAPDGQLFALPAWIPGSYMIREFARHIVTIAASDARGPVTLTKVDKHTWRAANGTRPLTLRYRVYAWDPSVRAAHLDDTHAFFNGTSVFLRVVGCEDRPHAVDVRPPTGRAYRGWRVATTLPEKTAARHGFGVYEAPDYDALIDHPVEMGTFRLEAFEAAGVPHEIAYTGVVPRFDAARVNDDLAVLCAAQIRFFGDAGDAATAAPFDRYVFLTTVSGEGYGGLEHRASTALLTSRDALPVEGDPKRDERSAGYLTFLGLVSHEYFHSWNVKRIKPAVFAPYDLAVENYTRLLWIFEGFTSYYDDLFLVRTGLATEDQYLGMLAKTIDDVEAGVGRTTQSVAESSFDAWVKYYRQDENTPNAVVSYYKKGSLVALCLDLVIRDRTRGRGSLDDVMRRLWSRYGRTFYQGGGRGLAEDAFPAEVREATGVDVADEVARWAYGTDELPVDALLARFGLSVERDRSAGAASLDAKWSAAGGDVRLSSVALGGAAHRAGLAAGDVLVAIDGLRASPSRMTALLARYRPDDSVPVVAFRNDVLATRTVAFGATVAPPRIVVAAKAKPRATEARGRWLRGGDPSR